jgi:nucleotide-binding universal stress UspA family protein
MEGRPPLEEIHLRRVLVAIDGSPSSELALGGALTVAHNDNAAVTLICVAPDMLAESSRWAWPTTPPPDQQGADDFAAKVLRDAVDRIPEDIPVRRVLKHGKAGPAICEEARSGEYDAILMGGRGVGRVQATLLGSVSQYVMKHADVPVFIAHAPREGSA